MRSTRRHPRPACGEGIAGEVAAVYNGSNGDLTLDLYRRLNALGPIGNIAVNVFRAQKASERAKVYRGGTGGQSYRSMAYEKKRWSMTTLCEALTKHSALGIRWGWAVDPNQEVHRHILYVDLPTGQVSWHTDQRAAGPDYPGEWDRAVGSAPNRICAWVAQFLEGETDGDR